MADTTQNILINIDLETGEVNNQLDTIDSKIKNLGDGAKIESFKSIKSEILAAREEAVRLAIAIEDAEAAGQNVDNLSRRYNEVTQRAAQLNDAVDEVNQSISNANPDNRLQGLTSIAQGAITAVQGVAGAFALVGVDAETAQVAVARLQGLIALTDAIGSVDKIVKGYRDLTNVINFASIAQKANNAATAAAAVVQRAFTGSVIATGTAFKVLRTAIITTGIGALVVALGFAIAALVDFAESQSDVEKASSDAADEIEREIEALDELSKTISNRNKVEIAQLRANGATEKQIRDRQLEDSYKAYERAYQLRELAAKKYNEGIRNADKETYDRLTAGLKTATDQANSLYQDYLQLGYQNRAADLADEKRVQDEKLQKQQEINQKRKQDLQSLNDFTEQQRQLEKQRFQTDLQNQIDEINKRYERALQLARAYGRNTAELERLRIGEINQITQQEIAKAEEFGVVQSLELVKKKVESIGKEINTSIEQVRNETQDSKQLREGIANVIRARNADITNVFQLGAQLRNQQINIERKARLDALKLLTFSTDPAINKARRESLAKIIEEDFKFQEDKIREEINDSEASLRKGIQVTLLEVDVQAAQRQIENAKEILDKLAQPFRVVSEEIIRETDEYSNTLRSALRRIFTTVDLEKEYATVDKFLAEITKVQKKNEKEFKDFQTQIGKDRNEIRQQQLQDERDYLDRRIELQEKFAQDTTFNLQQAEQDLAAEYESIANFRRQVLLDQDAETTRLQSELSSKSTAQIVELEKKRAVEIEKIRRPLATFEPGQDSFIRNFLSPESFRNQFDELIETTRSYYDSLAAEENAAFARQAADADFFNQNREKLEKEHKDKLVAIEKQYLEDVNLINDATLQSKLELLDAIGGAIGNLGALFDRNTAAAKIAGLAEIAINTGTGFIKGLDIAQKTAAGFGPGAAYAFPIFYAQQIAAVLAAASRAKQILAPVKGASSAGGGSTQAPSIPSAINASLFNLPAQAQNVRVVNQASQVVRAYITNEDLRSAQEKQAFLNKLSSF